ncbi:LEM domain-containing protein 1 isoform X2 [Gadus macrocephalus]|uniref:LEM domain-containing protein 1 isoform X2 n=1 Tax=Gadus macrocephalus TaxID=80720 RepID=UPI0028CBBDA3|nr:LEM domain-containing protein 1 isoform X2 [Gadus macrocephalus]
MPVFEEDPAQLSKSRLKSDLVAHNVTLPTEKSKKDVYVGLYLKHIDAKNAADFSSDEEDQVVNQGHVVACHQEDTPKEKPSAVDMLDVNGLTDDELKASLLKHGLNAGPIVASTRALYERRLLKILQSNMPSEPTVNGAGDANAYSDSEEEGDEEGKDEDSDSNDSRQEDILTLELPPENDKQRVMAPESLEPHSGRIVEIAVESLLEASWALSSHLPSVLGETYSVDEHTGLIPAVPSASMSVKSNTSSSSHTFSITQMVKEKEERGFSPVPQADGRRWSESKGQGDWSQVATPEQPKWELCTPKNESAYYTPNASYKQTEGLTVVPTRLYPSAVPILTGITATCRRPIKGAAGRPVLYKYPDAPPTSPMTLERREVDARLVPVYAQVLVFLAIACLLYLVYACMEENPYHPLLPLLDGLSEALESQEEGPVGLAHPGDPADTPVDL